MKSSTPSLRPFILWMIAAVLALADLLLRLTKDHIVWDTVYIPAAVAILFTAITIVFLRRLQREQKALRTAALMADAPAPVTDVSTDGQAKASTYQDIKEKHHEALSHPRKRSFLQSQSAYPHHLL